MYQDSLLSDIKAYEERLRNNPESFLFARLSEAYLKAQLPDDAIRIARQGVARYPAYIAGQRSLAMAAYAKGMDDECMHALRKVVAASPDDVIAQKMLGKLLVSSGDLAAAVVAYNTALEFSPEDDECLQQLQEIARKQMPVSVAAVADSTAEEQPEYVIELSETDIVVEDEAEEICQQLVTTEEKSDPLSTVTLAELYARQGFADKALKIYRELAVSNPDSLDIKARIAELESAVVQSSEAGAEAVSAEQQTMDVQQTAKQEAVFASSLKETNDRVVSVFESWLDNIRRLRLCR